MKITSLAAAFAAVLTLSACSAAPTAPAPSTPASFDVTNTSSLSGPQLTAESTTVSTTSCTLFFAPTTTTTSTTTSTSVTTQGTYAVAYGSTSCATAP